MPPRPQERPAHAEPTLDPSHHDDASAVTPPDGASHEHVAEIVERATKKIAPLWPLRSFVAVNPFLGLTDQTFEAAARTMARVAGARMTAPRAFYAAAIDDGRITRGDLAAALHAAPRVAGAPTSIDALVDFARGDDTAVEAAPTVVDVARDATGTDWPRFVENAVSTWAASHFDEGQGIWRSPWQGLSPYRAWRAEAMLDRAPELAGLAGFRATVRALPDSAEAAIPQLLARVAVPAGGLDTYLHRLLMTIGGWAGYARYRVWEAELAGGEDTTLVELLAVRLAWEVATLDALGAPVERAWGARRESLGATGFDAAVESQLAGELMLQAAFDAAVQRGLVAEMGSEPATAAEGRKAAQAVFCIDVRSEVFRRALESVEPGVETLGFAGFFGFPIEVVPFGALHGGAQCPVLLSPAAALEESVRDADGETIAQLSTRRELRRRAGRAWRAFKFAAVSCFGFVGPVGLAYAKKLVTDSLGRTRPVEHPSAYGLDADARARLAPSLTPRVLEGRSLGLTTEQRVAMAEGALRAMSLTDDLARVVVLVGHGSTTVNNPHASGLDCGACGGHTGEANARVAAAVLNDPPVRKALREKGIAIPDDTVFVAALHDTTTDEVTVFDRATRPASHAADLARLEASFTQAAHLARAERAPRLGLPQGAPVDASVLARSRDWSQVRPEWGLAGCSSFIVAPRERTRSLDLGGRAFLHSYAWQQDEGFGVLELIMTAPMVVASWISLQYYGSTVDNRAFGCGNKVLHNVVGTLGVLEGNGGDLRTGLPWQSVHDGEKLVHEPARLNVLIEAPVEAMTDVLSRHAQVRALVDHGWIHLFALDGSGKVAHRYTGDLTWAPVEGPDVRAAA